MEVNQEQRAGLAWNILVEIAKRKQDIRYNALSKEIGLTHHRPIRYVLDRIFWYCKDNHLPPLSILVINASGLPGTGFTEYYPKSLEQGFQEVYQENWDRIDNPFAYALDGVREADLINDLKEHPHSSAEVYTKVKVRGQIQVIFRKLLLDIYDYQCAICGISYSECLEACHIIPWNECGYEDRLNPQNGILLCSNHHKLFDAGWITIDNNYKIIIYPEEHYTKPNRVATENYRNKKIFVPDYTVHRPNRDYLKIHRNRFLQQ